MNKSLILTLLVTVNPISLSAAQPQEILQQQEQSWKKYMPTKKQVFIGACTIAAAGVALWYMRNTKTNKSRIDLRSSGQPQSRGITQQSSANSAPTPVTSSIAQTQIHSSPSAPLALATPVVAKPTSIKIDLRDKNLSKLREKAHEAPQLSKRGIITVHTYAQDEHGSHIKCIAFNGLGRELEDFCFDTSTQKILTVSEAGCAHLSDPRILRNVDHILKHPTEITLGKRKVTFTGPWTMEIEG